MRSLRSSGSVGGLAGHRRVYPATDALQRPLVPRSRFRQQLTPGVRPLHAGVGFCVLLSSLSGVVSVV
jgi:hypothetical protein